MRYYLLLPLYPVVDQLTYTLRIMITFFFIVFPLMLILFIFMNIFRDLKTPSAAGVKRKLVGIECNICKNEIYMLSTKDYEGVENQYYCKICYEIVQLKANRIPSPYERERERKQQEKTRKTMKNLGTIVVLILASIFAYLYIKLFW